MKFSTATENQSHQRAHCTMQHLYIPLLQLTQDTCTARNSHVLLKGSPISTCTEWCNARQDLLCSRIRIQCTARLLHPSLIQESCQDVQHVRCPVSSRTTFPSAQDLHSLCIRNFLPSAKNRIFALHQEVDTHLKLHQEGDTHLALLLNSTLFVLVLPFDFSRMSRTIFSCIAFILDGVWLPGGIFHEKGPSQQVLAEQDLGHIAMDLSMHRTGKISYHETHDTEESYHVFEKWREDEKLAICEIY